MSTVYTKTSFKDALLTRPTKQLSVVLSDDYKSIDLNLRNTNPLDLTSSNSRYTYYNSYHKVAIIDPDKLDVRDWSTEMEKLVSNGGTIGDKDKVYFTKSALFPRASFNRYSNKARLVQTVKAATKFAFPNKFIQELNVTDIELFEVIHSKDGISDEFTMGIGLRTYYDAISSLNPNSQTPDEKTANVKYSRMNHYQRHDMNTKEIHKALQSRLEKELGGVVIITPKQYKVLRTNTLKTKESFQFFMSGEMEFDQIVSDNVVNDYIDTFKDSLDESTYEYLISTLSAHTSDPEVPMQLLTNMKIEPGNPRLDALFINLNQRAINNIISNRVMKTVDVKNFWETHGLSQVVGAYSHNNLQSKLNLIGARARKYVNNEARQLLFELVKEGVEESINQELGFSKDGSSYLKLKYENI